MTSVKVYVVSGVVGPVKIGSSRSPIRRMAGLQTGYPQRLRCHGTWEHPRADLVEGRAQTLLARSQLVGEWFNVPVTKAIAAVERAIRIVDGVEAAHDAQTVIPCMPPFSVPRQKHVAVTDGIHRMGYVRDIPGCAAETQINWLLASGVCSLDIWMEGNEGAEAIRLALKDYRVGDLLLA